ncbi:acyl carrier protein [Pseudomonas baltica]|jgi:acyl carrier protein|uniref:acyl carrier protein n=1 Tax=Pseudomonas baltica TaxID=2762576 RepID=UPI00289C44C1|nr:acyl carrier protein [Pseudomonas baltica]
MQSKSKRDDLCNAVIDVFVSTIGFIPRDEVSERSNFVSDFKIIDDDLTVFMLEIDKTFELNSTQKDWQPINTIGQIVDLIIWCRAHPADYPPRSTGRRVTGLAWLTRKLGLSSAKNNKPE